MWLLSARSVSCLRAALLVATLAGGASSVGAQCAMCRTTLAQSEEGKQVAEGLNRGIVFLLVIPALLVSGFAIGLGRQLTRTKDELSAQAPVQSPEMRTK